jgi:hypothetical protein
VVTRQRSLVSHDEMQEEGAPCVKPTGNEFIYYLRDFEKGAEFCGGEDDEYRAENKGLEE